MYSPLWIVLGLSGWLAIGGMLGYLAGTLVGGVFLIAEAVRRIFTHLTKRSAEMTPEAEASES
jgi:hypothetical protein